MKTVILDVRSPDDSMADFVRVWKTGKAEKPHGSALPPRICSGRTAKRSALLKALCGAGPVSIREAALRVGHDVKAVHEDVTALLKAGVLDRPAGGGIVIPYEAVKVEFLLRAA